MTDQQPIRATALKAGRLSMAHMHLAMQRRAGQADDELTPAMRWGRLVHMAILEPEVLASLPVWRGAFRRGKEWQAFAADLGADGDYVTEAELAGLLAIGNAAAVALARLPAVEDTEVDIKWQADDYGAAMAKLDAILADGGVLEVKTTSKIEERAFRSQAWSLGYPLQLGWYDHAARLEGFTGRRILLAVESKPPHTTALWEIGPQTLRDGYSEGAQLAVRYRECEKVGRFPGPYDSEGIMALEPPAWALHDEIDMNGMEGPDIDDAAKAITDARAMLEGDGNVL